MAVPTVAVTHIIGNEELASIKLTDVDPDVPIRKIFEEVIFLKFGEIVQIVTTNFFSDMGETVKTDAYVYFKPTHPPFMDRLNISEEPFPLVQMGENKPIWMCEKNTVVNHFRTDPYEHKRLLIQSINSKQTSKDVYFMFREHGDLEQVDMVWTQSSEYPLPTRVQVYMYFREWGGEIFTYKLLEELNEVGVFTIRYDYTGHKDLLWVYELCPKEEHSIEFPFVFGRYRRWIPEDDPQYGSRKEKNNKLNWYFTKAGKFAYAERIVEDELLKHGGLFLGPDKTFYEVEITKRPMDIAKQLNYANLLPTSIPSVKEEEWDESEVDLQEAQKLLMEVIQRCMVKLNIPPLVIPEEKEEEEEDDSDGEEEGDESYVWGEMIEG